MTWNTQRDAKSQVKQTRLITTALYKFLPQSFERDYVMVSVQVAVVCAAILAGVTVALEHASSPRNIRLGLAEYLVLLGYAAFPVMGLLAASITCAFRLRYQELFGAQIVERQELRDSDASSVHVRSDANCFSASTLAKVSALITRYPKVNAAIVCAAVIAGILLSDGPAHVTQYIRFNTDLQVNGVNCWKPYRPMVEGNQQPSAANGEVATVAAKVQRLAGEEPTNKPATSAPRESDDIVHARSNAGKPCQWHEI